MGFEYKFGDQVCYSNCTVKYSQERLKTSSKHANVRTTTPTTTTTTTTVPVRNITEVCEKLDTNYFGNTIECLSNTPSWEQCANVCFGESECTHWSWFSGDVEDPNTPLDCCLKTSDAGKIPQTGVVSGSEECGTCEEMDTDLMGDDIGAVLDVESWEECSHICQQRSDCSYWTWVSDEFEVNPDILHKCHLKDGDSGRRPTKGLISGSSDCGKCEY